MKVIILCGGRGTRLKRLTDSLPKPLIMLNDKPIIQHIIELYMQKNCRQFITCVGYLGDKIKAFIENASFEADFQFSDLGENASMLERIFAASDLMAERAVVTYGDTLVNIDLDAMLAFHKQNDALITLTTAKLVSPFGLIQADENHQVSTFTEKPVQTYYVGQMILEKRAFEHLNPNLLERPDGEGLVQFIQDLINKGRVWMYPYSGPQITFNTEQELVRANKAIIDFYTYAGNNE